MLIELLETGPLMIGLVFLLFYRPKRKPRPVKLSKNHNDTTGARFAINEKGFLEEIHHDNLSSHSGN